jgi:hypothetical protein
VQEMRDSGIAAGKLRGVFSADQLQQVGYPAADLMAGDYPAKDIVGAG